MDTQTQPETTTVPKIHAAIMAVMEDIGAIEKTRKNTGQNFMFRGVAETLAACHPLFIKHKIYVHPLRVSHHTMEPNVGRDGNNRGTHVFQTIVYRATSAEDGSFVDGESSGEAIDFQDKSSGKVMSISFKCFIFQLFCIPEEKNESDPDQYSPNSTQKPAQQPAQGKPAASAPKVDDPKTKAITDLVTLLKHKGIAGKKVLPWLSALTMPKRELAKLSEINAGEFEEMEKVANELPAPGSGPIK